MQEGLIVQVVKPELSEVVEFFATPPLHPRYDAMLRDVRRRMYNDPADEDPNDGYVPSWTEYGDQE